MPSRLHLTAFITIAAVIWGILLVVDGVAVQLSWLRPISIVIGSLVFLLGIFDLYLWRLPLLQGWFVKRPNLRGTWRCELRPISETNNTKSPIEAYMTVRQTYSMLSLRLMTVESTSETLAGDLIRAHDGTFKVANLYQNQPLLSRRHESPIHHGGLLLDVNSDAPESLTGSYWTDRKSLGEIRLIERHPKVIHDYELAKEVFAKSSKT